MRYSILPLLAWMGACATTATNDDPPPSTEPDAGSAVATDAGRSPEAAPPAPILDAGTDAAKGIEFCGAAPYAWLPPAGMGTILEEVPRSDVPQLVITALLLKANQDRMLKTNRLPKHSAKTSIIRYQTQDRGQLADATAMITRPDAAGTFPVMLLLHGTAGFHDACAPTRGVADAQFGGFTNDGVQLASMFASFGYIVVFPDYLGLKSIGPASTSMHSYLVGEPTAIASLDAVRAAKTFLNGKPAQPGDLVVVGGSQGGHAAAFVSRYQPHYAPELPIKASVWDVPPSDLLAHAKRSMQQLVSASGNSMLFLTAAESWYRTAPRGVSEVLAAPYDVDLPQAMRTQCSLDFPTNATLGSLFTPAVLSAANTDYASMTPWGCYIRENSLPTTSVPKLDDVPTLMLLAEKDTLVDTPTERASMQKLCAQGHRIEYLECKDATHTKPLSYALDQWLKFLEDRLRGVPMPATTCMARPAEKCTSQP